MKRQRTEAFPFYFSPPRAQRIIDFFEYLHHSKGVWSTQVFRLEPWQQFCLGSVFGWLQWNGTKDDPSSDARRFTEALIAVGRKNGKTTMLSGVGLYGLLGDGEPGAEIWCFATKEDQAKLLWDEACRMRDKSPELAAHTKKTHKAILIEGTASKFGYLGADSETQDGLNPHFGICDELHAHPNRKLYDVVKSGQGARVQPLMFTITTAGTAREGCFCRTLEEQGEKILQQVLTNERFFFYMASINFDPTQKPEDREHNDDWEDEKNWVKANPNLGISVNIDFLRGEAATAKNDPSSLNNFLTKYMNLWVQQEKRWIPLDKWSQCGHVHIADNAMTARTKFIEANKGRKCYAGVDLSARNDLTALVLVFPPIAEKLNERNEVVTVGDPYTTVLPWFFVPKDSMFERVKKGQVPYDVWEREGFLTATEGNVVDYSFVQAKLNELKTHFQIVECGYDPWNAQQFAQTMLAQGAKMVEVRQGPPSLGEPCKELLRLITSAKLRHFNNPVLTWNASNVSVKTDSNANIAPDKEHSAEKIDGISATVTAMNRLIANAGTKKATPKIFAL
jgi:phage terminase large subunit-like protein